MGDSVQEYEIKTLNDIVQLDSRQRVQFLKDLVVWLEYQDKCAILSKELGVEITTEGMIWRDDDITGASGLIVNGERVFDLYGGS